MIVELVSVLAVFIGGSAFVYAAGLRGWVIPAFGYISGLTIMVTIGAIQAITGISTSPILNIGLTLTLPGLWWIWQCYNRRILPVKLIPSAATLTLIIALVAIFREARLVNWHTDSFRYVMTGALLAGGNYDTVSINLVTKRLLAVPIMNAPANLNNELYLRSIMPLLAISCVMILAWFIQQGLRGRLSKESIRIFILLGVLLLITNNRFVWNAFYINGHLFFAVTLLLIAGCWWLLARENDLPKQALFIMPLVAIPALIVTRPEAFMVAGLTMLPMVFSEKIDWKHKAITLSVYGLSVTAWHSFVVSKYSTPPLSAVGPLILGLTALLIIPLLYWAQPRKIIERYSKQLILLFELMLWAVLLLFIVREPEIFTISLSATIDNAFLGHGAWGASIAILIFLTLTILVFTDIPDRLFLRLPVTTFLPVSFLLAYMRESPYRVGHGDSLNRSLIHIVPLAILLVVSAAETERWKPQKRYSNYFECL